jgi:hypothetical protein
MYVQCNTEARSCNVYCSGEAIIIAYYERVFVDLGIQNAIRIHLLSSVACPALQHFSHIIS